MGHAEAERDGSANIWWLGLLQLEDPGSARPGCAWYQVDAGWYFIRTLELVGLAQVRRRAA
jgi:fatty-acid desaturase